jgi:hypothetical protein
VGDDVVGDDVVGGGDVVGTVMMLRGARCTLILPAVE